MNIHEYQAKDILKKYGVAVQGGIVADIKYSGRRILCHSVPKV